MLEVLEPVKRAWAAVNEPALAAVRQAWQSVELQGPQTASGRPSQVSVGGAPSGLPGGPEARGVAQPSRVPATPVSGTGQQRSGTAPLWVLAQVEPWGVRADYDFMLAANPGLQDIYLELRTTGREDTGGRPLRPQIARAALQYHSASAEVQKRVEEAFERSFADPVWGPLVHARNDTDDASAQEAYDRQLREYVEKRALTFFSRR